MKLRIIILFLFAALAAMAWADNVGTLEFHMSTGEVKSVAVSRIDSITFDTHTAMLEVAFTDGSTSQLPMAGIDSMCHATLPDGVYVSYEEDKAKVANPYAFDGIEVTIDGAKVTVTSAMNSGALTIASAMADGMHANDSVIIRGGAIQICADDDAIDCEGLLCIRGGEVTNTSHTLMYGVTSVSEATESYFDGVFTMEGQISGGSSKTFTPKTK